MNKNMRVLLLAGAVALGSASAHAQSASTVGSGGASHSGNTASGTVGSGGSAAAGGTSASTLGLGGTSTSPSGTSSTIGSAGSAAGGTKDTSSTKIHGDADNLHGTSKARAQDGGTWSRSMTKTKVKDDTLTSRTKSMSHEPGGPPAKSRTSETVGVGQ